MPDGQRFEAREGDLVSSATIPLIVLIALAIGAMPAWAHSRNWGYRPSAGLAAIALVLLVMLAMGEL
jgi:hypothetical protein